MLLRQVQDVEIGSGLIKSDYDIDEAKRFIYIYVDRGQLERGERLTNMKALQVNMAVQTGIRDNVTNDLMIDTTNNSVVRISMYAYDVITEANAKHFDVKNMAFMLKNAYSTETGYDFDRTLAAKYNIGLYNTELSMSSDTCDRLQNSWLGSAITLKPTYYTQKHMYTDEKDIYDLLWAHERPTYMGFELIDQFTTIEIHDIKTWDTMFNSIFNDLREYSVSGMPDYIEEIKNESINIKDVSGNMFNVSGENNFDDVMFIHDTVHGENIRRMNGTIVPFVSKRIGETITEDLKYTRDILRMIAKRFENKYGPLRISYHTALTGDAVKITCYDYKTDNQPINQGMTYKLDRGVSTMDMLSQLLMVDDSYDYMEHSWQTPFN